MALRSRTVLVFCSSALALSALVAGCGSSHSTAPLSTGDLSSATGLAQGVITGFGTIHFGRGTNERVYHTEGATLTLYDDGVTRYSGGEDDASMFKLGMKVKMYCDKNDSTHAREVIFMNDVEGPITAKPSGTSGATFDVLDVPVLADANTHFDDDISHGHGHSHSGLTLDSLKVGNVVEVSGNFDANGILHATFVEAKSDSAAGQTFEIKGLITDLSGAPPTQTFKVHGASFTTDMNTHIDNLSMGLADSVFVQVKTMSTTSPFLATRVSGLESDDDHHGHGEGDDDNDHNHHHVQNAEVEGFVTGLTGTSPNFSFMLDMKNVVTSSATKGLSLVMANAHIEVKGPVDSTGTIMAQKISREDD